MEAVMDRVQAALASMSPRHLDEPEGFTRAAVLVPMMVYPDGVHLSLMKRTDAGGPHSGQISFPGGRPEPSDLSPVDTALRETGEEFGIPSDAVTVMGRLDDEITVTGYVVTPVVGRIEGPFDYAPDSGEVEEVFEVPLSFFLDPANEHKAPPVDFRGRQYELYQFEFEGRVIWGMTARIIHGFAGVLREHLGDQLL